MFFFLVLFLSSLLILSYLETLVGETPIKNWSYSIGVAFLTLIPLSNPLASTRRPPVMEI